MKNVLFAYLFLFFSTVAWAKEKTRDIDSHISYVANSTSLTKVNDYAVEIIGKIISVIGLKPNFEVKAANVPNAAAVVYNGKRYVLYNPTFINSLVKAAGNEWAAVSVLAHEIGHHLNGHTLENHGSRPDQELEADEFSGFVLRRMGASLAEAQVAMKLAANARGTETHPAKYDRMTAIASGWKNADDQMLGKQDMSVNKPDIQKREEITRTSPAIPIADKYIAANVHFNADEGGKYFVTTKMNLVKVEDDQLYLIGKVSSIENQDFPFMIHDEKQTRLLVSRKGNIFNSRGKEVGYLEVK